MRPYAAARPRLGVAGWRAALRVFFASSSLFRSSAATKAARSTVPPPPAAVVAWADGCGAICWARISRMTAVVAAVVAAAVTAAGSSFASFGEGSSDWENEAADAP
jgi:hypothetical protein